MVLVETMHERKALMAQEADAFLALPGGFGTLDEFFEILTWAQLGIHAKPCVLVNTAGYFDHLLSFLQMAIDQGFLKPENYALIHIVADAAEALNCMQKLWQTLARQPRRPGRACSLRCCSKNLPYATNPGAPYLAVFREMWGRPLVALLQPGQIPVAAQ